MLQKSIATVCLSGNLGEKIVAAAEAGFDAVEVFESDLTCFHLSPAEVRQLAANHGIGISAMQPFRDFEALPEPMRSNAFDRAERKFDLLQELGTDLMLICSNVSPETMNDTERAADDFRELGERAAKRGIRVAYEALAWGRFVHDYTQAWEIVEKANHDNIGLVLDSYHIFVRDNPLSKIAHIPVEKIFLVQVADAPKRQMEVLQHSRHLRGFPGQGDYPIVEFLHELEKIGYRGPIAHEIFNDEFRAASAKQTAIDGYRSYVWLEEQLHRRVQPVNIDTSGDRLLREPFILSETPPRASVDNIAFIEFAARDEDAEKLERVIGALGFEKSHQHRSKDVLLFTQGDINILLNRQENSFAHHYYSKHGCSVCALGLNVRNRSETLKRAQQLHCTLFESSAGPGELDLPAVSGSSGSLFYFLEGDSPSRDFKHIDFESLKRAGENDLGLMEVDHVAQAVAPTELLSDIFSYRVVLGLEPRELTQEIVDPHGLVTSRVVSNENGKVKFVLNASKSRDTATERFRSEHSGGAGAQHIAFRCQSISEFADKVDPDIILPLPNNYYQDLIARYNLHPDQITFSRRHNILYDRAGECEFFQMYTREINGLFFEIVERRHYTHFGEFNAPVRLAAQDREHAEIG